MKKQITITMNESYLTALAVISSDAYPYADDRDWGPVFECFIEEYLLREGGRLGRIEDNVYKTINQR